MCGAGLPRQSRVGWSEPWGEGRPQQAGARPHTQASRAAQGVLGRKKVSQTLGTLTTLQTRTEAGNPQRRNCSELYRKSKPPKKEKDLPLREILPSTHPRLYKLLGEKGPHTSEQQWSLSD